MAKIDDIGKEYISLGGILVPRTDSLPKITELTPPKGKDYTEPPPKVEKSDPNQ